MSTPDPVPTPDSIPWYKSAVLRGIAIAAASQVLLRLKQKLGIDLSAYGIDANNLAEWVLDACTGIALSYAAHGRIAKPNPPITFRKTPPAPPAGAPS